MAEGRARERLWPRSLRGQVLLAVMLALLVAQAVSAALLLRATENRRDAAVLNAAALQLVRQDAPRLIQPIQPASARRWVKPQ